MLPLEDADLVLTTYHTIVSDFGDKSSPLHAMEWYRVVLDEGISIHYIQEMKASLTAFSSYHPTTSHNILQGRKRAESKIPLVSHRYTYPEQTR